MWLRLYYGIAFKTVSRCVVVAFVVNMNKKYSFFFAVLYKMSTFALA